MESISQNQKRICRLCWIKCENFEVIGGYMKDNMDMLLLKTTGNTVMKENDRNLQSKRQARRRARRDENLVVTEQPVICMNCAELVKKCFAFKSMCLDIRDHIISFVNDKGNTKLDLKDVCLSQKKNNICIPDDHSICGFCMGLVESCSAVSLDIEGDNVLQKLMLEKCLPELDLTIIRKPIICTVCHGSLEDYYQFMTSCLLLEEKVQKYCKTHNIATNKTDVLQVVLSDILMSKDGDTANAVDELKYFMNRENAEELDEVEDKNLMEMENNKKIVDVLFTSKDELSCEEEDKKDDFIVKSEEEFYLHQANEVTQKNENFVEIEDQKCLLNDEFEIKTEQELDRYQDSVNPQSNISTNTKVSDLLEHKISEKHNFIQNGNSVYQCDCCSFQANSKGCLHRHSVIHKNVSQMHQCEFCTFQTKFKKPLKSHMLIHKRSSRTTISQCEKCSFQTKNKKDFKLHLLVHKEPVKLHQCDSCPYQTKHKHALKRHILVHRLSKDVPVYQCDSCLFQTRWKENLKEHVLLHKNSSEGTKYQCDSCSYQTNHTSHFKRHYLVHRDSSEVTMYQCNSCSYQTKRKDALKMHVLIHRDSSEVAMYQCYACSYQTKYKNRIKLHVLTHKNSSELTMYKCNTCSHETKYKHGLKMHSLVHRGSSEGSRCQCSSCSCYAKRKCLKDAAHKD